MKPEDCRHMKIKAGVIDVETTEGIFLRISPVCALCGALAMDIIVGVPGLNVEIYHVDVVEYDPLNHF